MESTFHPGVVRGRAQVPGDKSISHRALMLAAMCRGRSEIRGLSPGGDVSSTADCLAALGVTIENAEGRTWVQSDGWPLPRRDRTLDCRNSGTTMRLLSGLLAGAEGGFVLKGDDSLSSRPMLRIAEPLRQMGAFIETAPGDTAPLFIKGRPLKGIEMQPSVASAQVKSAVLLAGTMAEGRTVVVEQASTRDHTERLMKFIGAPVSIEGNEVVVDGSTHLPLAFDPFTIDVPGDFSSAAYLLVAACLTGSVQIDRVGLNLTRTGFIDVLNAMGANIQVEVDADDPEPFGTASATKSVLYGTTVSGALIPRCIDELPLIALAATQAEGITTIRNASELRVKETDRLSLLGEGLRRLGAQVEELVDGMVIEGGSVLKGGVVESHGDHRLAMTFAIAGAISKHPVTVRGWECADISFPGFKQTLKKMMG